MRSNILTCMLILGCVAVTVGLFCDRAATHALPVAIPRAADDAPSIPFAAAPPFPEEYILLTKLTGLQLPQKPTLEQALTAVSDAVHCQLQVKWDVLQQVGVRRTDSVQLYEPIVDLSAEDALNRILFGATDSAAIEFIVKDHTIVVSTWDDLSTQIVTLAYDVRDLIQAYIEAMQVPGEAPIPHLRAAEAIMDFLTGSVEPGTWLDNGGNTGRRFEFMGILFITQTRKNHNAIAEQFVALRQISRAKLPTALERKHEPDSADAPDPVQKR